MRYRIIAVGVNFMKGFLTSLPSFAIGSLPDLICLPSDTKSVVFLDRSTPSNVSVSASSTRNVLLRSVKRVELSLRTSKAALTAAKGPLVKAMTAIWGRYVKTNMKVVIPTPSVMVGASLLVRGFHSDRWEIKYAIPCTKRNHCQPLSLSQGGRISWDLQLTRIGYR